MKKDFKSFSNEIFGTVKALLELGLYCVSQMLKPMVDELQRKSSSCNQGEWYDSDVKEKMVKVSLLHLDRIQTVVKSHFADFKETEEEKIRAFSSPKVTFLLGRLMQRAELGDMRYFLDCPVCLCIINSSLYKVHNFCGEEDGG